MQKKSALTAALSGAPGSEAPAAPSAAAPKRSALDLASMPCLAYAAEIDAVLGRPPPAQPLVLEGLTEDLGALQLDNVVPVGSAPTNVVLNGVELADYPLNPRRRRGGQEMAPEAAAVGTPGSLRQQTLISQAVIGSLPKGLSEQEKLKILQVVPPSPSSAALKEMPVDVLTARTLAGQKMRRQVLKGAVVVFVTAGYSGKRFIFEKAKELGVRSVVIDGQDSWIKVLEQNGTIEKFIPMDFADAETVFDRCYAAIKEVRAKVGDIDAVTTFCEMAVPLAARLAEKLGLPGNTPEAVDNARDKFLTRDLMEKAGLPTPRHFMIQSTDDLAKAAEHVGFPAVIKPISGAASIGVIRCNSLPDLEKAYARVHSDLKKARIVAGALVEGDDESEDVGNAGSWIKLVVLMEEYLDGDEVDCDLVFSNGRPVYGAITDNWPTIEPYFNETGSNCPSVLPQAVQAELLELAVRSVQCLGFRLGVFHVECKYTSRGARLIEVNCRMGGGPVRDTNLLVWGVDMVEEHIMACAGIPLAPLIARKPLKQLAEYSVNAKVTGILEHVDYLNKWQGHPDVMYARPLVQPGHRCVCVQDGLPTWVCELMVVKPNVVEAIQFIKDIEASLDMPIKPKAIDHHIIA